MATGKGRKQPLPPLDPKVARRFLDLMSTDNEFRRLFKKDAQAALVKAGWRPPKGPPGTVPLQYGACMQMQAGERIATKQQIVRARARLEQAMTSEWGFHAPFANSL